MPAQIITLFAIFGILASFAKTSVATEAVAMITDITGKASITTNGEQKPCEILMSTSSGDELHLEANSKLTLVYFKSAKEYTFLEKSVIKITPEAPEVKSGSKATIRDLQIAKEANLLPINEYSQAAIVFRGARKKPKIKLIYPVNSTILDPLVIFEWLPIEKVLQYRYILTDGSGRTVIETLVNGTSFKLPDENNIEEGVAYSWQVEARLSTGAVYSNSSSFSLIDKAELERINRLRPKDGATFSERIVFATLLEQLGLRDEARIYWKVLSFERPENKLLTKKASELR